MMNESILPIGINSPGTTKPNKLCCDVISGLQPENNDAVILSSQESYSKVTTGSAVPDPVIYDQPSVAALSTAAAKVFDESLVNASTAWTFKADDSFATATVGPDGAVYAGSDDHKLYAVKDGKKLWSFKTGEDLTSSPIVSDGIVYVGGKDKQLYAIIPPETSVKRIAEAPESSPNSTGEAAIENTEEWLIIDGVSLKKNR